MIFSTVLMVGGLDTFFILFLYALDDFLISILTISVLLIVFNPIIIRFNNKTEKKICYFLLTNINLYVYHYEKSPLLSENVHSYPLTSFKGIVFHKRFFDKNFDSGTIEFVTNELIPKKISIKNVPNIQKLQNLIESIFFYYGNVEERLRQICNETDYQFPQIYDISIVKLKQLKKLKVIYLVVFILNPIFCYLLNYIISLFVNELVVTVVIYSCGVAFAIIVLTQIFRMVKRTSYKNNQLVFSENEFLLKMKKTSYKIPLNKKTTINFEFSKGPLVSHRNILENYDFIKISKSYNSKEFIKFGPFTKLPYILNFLFSYILVWKSNHGYLLSKEEIIKLNLK